MGISPIMGWVWLVWQVGVACQIRGRLPKIFVGTTLAFLCCSVLGVDSYVARQSYADCGFLYYIHCSGLS